MRIAVTRPSEDAIALIMALQLQGHQVISAPLLKIEITPPTMFPVRHWQALVLTSANAVRALSVHPQLREFLSATCCCVGPASAAAARQLGFTDVHAAGGGLHELKQLITGVLDPAAGPLLYPSGEVVSGEMEIAGFEIHRAVVYAAVPAQEFGPSLRTAIRERSLDGVMLYSPRSAQIWAKLLRTYDLLDHAQNVVHYCLSRNVADALSFVSIRKIAATPDDKGMLALTALQGTDHA